MRQLAILLRAMQLYSHSAHHLCARVAFFQDHEFFSETYQQLESGYDSVIERIIGIYGEESLNLQELMMEVLEQTKDCPSIGVKENKTFYEYQLKFEKELCQLVEQLCKNPKITQGTIQTIATISELSEIRQYKIKQRLK